MSAVAEPSEVEAVMWARSISLSFHCLRGYTLGPQDNILYHPAVPVPEARGLAVLTGPEVDRMLDVEGPHPSVGWTHCTGAMSCLRRLDAPIESADTTAHSFLKL